MARLRPIVVFDLDNTLVHSRIDFLGIRHTVIDRLLEVGAIDERPANPRVRAIPEWLEVARKFDPALGEELWRVVDRFERDGMLHGAVEPDARATLDRLAHDDFALAVLTNNSLDSAEAALERFDLRAPLSLVLARGVVAELKPGGAGVAQAHHDLGGGPTYLVGDSYIDGLAAQRAGVGARFVAFRGDVQDMAEHGVQPWARVQALAELPELLGSGVAAAQGAPRRSKD